LQLSILNSQLAVASFYADEAFRLWHKSYRDAARDGEAAMINLGRQSAEVLAKSAVLAASIKGVAAAGVVGAGMTMIGLVNEFESLIETGDVDGANVALGALSLAFEGAVGNFVGGVDIGKQLNDIRKDVAAMDATAAANVESYDFRRQEYLKRTREMFDIENKHQAMAASIANGDCDPDEPEPPDEEDEEELDDEPITRNDSWDPNDVVGPAGYGPERWIRRDHTTLPYTIRFENEPTAAAPAREVRISHTLDASLDWTTFAFGDIGFGDYTLTVPPGRQTFFTRFDLQSELGMYVDVSGDFDLTSGMASWYFAAVDPTTFDLLADPTGGFLPPNLSSPEGEGFVNFTVRARDTAVTGETITAQASIIFDNNEAIETPEYVNTLDAEPPTSGVNALPAESPPNFTVSWSGGDGAGSGVAFYNVYVSVDGGPFARWLHRTTATSATFNGEAGRHYAFYSVATDNVGWRQPTPTAAQASTTVVGGGGEPEYKLFLPMITR
jgi:hypothetical protein